MAEEIKNKLITLEELKYVYDALKPSRENGFLKCQVVTQAEYNAIQNPDEGILYIIEV